MKLRQATPWGPALALFFSIGSAVSEVASAPHSAPSEHAANGSAAGHEEHHQAFNWYQGMLSESEREPNLLWRRPGTPPPFAALLLHTALLAYLLVRFGKQPVAKALAARRQSVSRAVDEAAAMEAEARQQLARYEQQLGNLDAEITRVKEEMREAAETERKRVLQEAAVRRERIEREARTLLSQELKAACEALEQSTKRAALLSARSILKEQLTTHDDRRLCDVYLDRGVFGDLRNSIAPSSVHRSVGGGPAGGDTSTAGGRVA